MNKLNFIDCVQSKYKYTGNFYEGLASVKGWNELYGFINRKGEEVIECQYVDVLDFHSGLAAVKNKEGLWGYINKEGNEVIPCQFLDVKNFSECLDIQLAPVMVKGGWTYINKNGYIVLNEKFVFASEFSDEYGIVQPTRVQREYYIDETGKTYSVLFGKYKSIEYFHNGFALAKDDENIYLINKKFEVVSQKSKDSIRQIYPSINGLYKFKDLINGKVGYLDENLNKKIGPIYKKGNDFCEDVAIVELSDDFIGFVNLEGKATVFSKKYQYQSMRSFSEGLSVVENTDGLYGYINKEGKEIIPCQFKDADDFSEGLAGVIDTDGNFHYIDKLGNIQFTIDTIYSSLLELDDKTIYISATDEEEFKEKKLQVLKLIKEEILNQVIDNIDNLAYDHTDGLYQHTRVKEKK